MLNIDKYLFCPFCKKDFPEADELLNRQIPFIRELKTTHIEKIKCSHCNHIYFVKNGIPFLLAEDEYSIPLLKEIVQYKEFYHRIQSQRIERDRLQYKKEEITKNLKLYKHAYEEGVKRIDFRKNPLILDVGAGMCETSYDMALKGAKVIATELSPLDFFNPRFFSLHDEECESFYQVFQGVRKIPNENINFLRVICNAEKLPFKNEIFDVIFFRSMLHHALSLDKLLNEASRVLKKEGSLIVVSEPNRPFGEPEEKFLQPIIDYQEGIRERYLKFSDYYKPILENGFSFPRVQIFIPYYGYWARKAASLFGKNLNPDYWHDKILTKNQIRFRLPLLCTAINLYSDKVKETPIIPQNIDDSAKYFHSNINQKGENIFESISLSELLCGLDKNFKTMKKIIRESIPQEKINSEIYLSKEKLPPLAKGWRLPEIINGKKARYAFRDAQCLLKSINTIKSFAMSIYFPEITERKTQDIKPYFKIYVNDILLAEINEDFSGWKDFTFPLKDIDNTKIFEIKIEQEKLAILHDGREVGIAVEKISIS